MTSNQFFNKLLRELSYRSTEGYPILAKKEHQDIISDILSEWGLSSIESELIQNLTEGGEEDAQYKHLGQGFYVKAGDAGKEGAQKFTKDDNGKYSPVSDDEYEKQKNKAGEEGGPTNNPNAEPQEKDKGEEGQAVGGEQPPAEPEKGTSLQDPQSQERFKKETDAAEKATRESNRKYSKKDQASINDFQRRIGENTQFLSAEQQELVNEALSRIENLYDENSSDELKKESAQWLVDNMKFSTNDNGTKAYFNALGGNRKIISGKAGTASAAELVNRVKQHAEVREHNQKGIKDKLSSAAKPDLGKENEASPKKHKQVQEFFQSNPILSRVTQSLWGFFAVMDENGNPKMPSNKYTKEYLEQSFKNPALDRTIQTATEMSKNGEIDEKFVSALQNHKDRLQTLLDKYESPSEELATAIDESYNQMMVDLHEADADAASAVMKQLAENRLYETLLARGQEVYLPSKGNFPAGDVIMKDGSGMVSLISCKFGKSGRTYGCPANAKAIQSVHPDPNKREITGQYLGEGCHLLVLNDDLYRGDTKEETIDKTKKFVINSLGEIGLTGVFNEEELQEYATIIAEYTSEIEKIKQEMSSTSFPSKDKYWEEFGKRLAGIDKEYATRMGKIMTEERIEKLIGKNNVGNARNKKGEVPVEVALCMINDANSIRTSDGYGLEHNKQYYDDNGEPHFVTDKGTNEPNDYSITYRTRRTAGRAGGGPQYSFTGDGKVPDTMVDNENTAYDTESGDDLDD